MKQKRTPEEQTQRKKLRDLYCGVFVVTVLVWVLRFCLVGLASLATPYFGFFGGTALTVCAEGFSVFLPFFCYQKLRREPVFALFSGRPRSDFPLLRSFVGVLSVGGLSFAGAGLVANFLSFLEAHGVHSSVSVPDLGADWKQTLFAVVLSTAVSSFVLELSFRGIAMSAMREENRMAALLVSTICFTCLDADPYHILVRLLVGTVLGGFFLRVRSLPLCVLLQAVSQVSVSLWWVAKKYWFTADDFVAVETFLVVIGLVVGLLATVFLFFPRREPDPQKAPRHLAVVQVFASFGVYLILGLVVFNLFLNVFSTDADPADPLLQPTPDYGTQEPLQFDHDQELSTATDAED